MNWQIKCAAFKLLSALPGGAKAYRFFQERVTHSLDPTRARLEQKIDEALRYHRWLFKNGRDPALRGSHIDLGAGWHPTIPLMFYSLGVERQWLFDVTPLLNDKLVAATARVFLKIASDPAWPHRDLIARLPPQPRGGSWQEYLSALGISYSAPYFEKARELRGRIDFVTSTQALLHAPPAALDDCFAGMRDALRPGGVFLATIHLIDLFAHTDPTITKYNHLRFSEEEWARWSSPLMSFNRLKAPDYRERLEAAGFRTGILKSNTARRKICANSTASRCMSRFALATRAKI